MSPRVVALVLLFAACAHRSPPPPTPARDYPGALVIPSQVPVDFLAQQSVEARYGDRSVHFSAALQKRGDTLTLLGLTPFGTRAFLLEQRGVEVTFTPYLSRDLPFPPKNILVDVQRAYFIGLPGAPLPDGEHLGVRDGEEVRERWSAGRLVERRFRRLAADPPGEIVIAYEPGMIASVPPATVRFHNGWFGYDLVIETRSYQAL